MPINKEEKNISLKDFAGEHNQEVISNLLKENAIVIMPEIFMEKECVNVDLINLVKTLRKNGIKVDTSLTKDVVEKRASDIVLMLGVMGSTIAVPIMLHIVGSYIYERFVKDKEKKDIPTVRVGYYKKDNEEYVKYEGPADELSETLKKLRENQNG